MDIKLNNRDIVITIDDDLPTWIYKVKWSLSALGYVYNRKWGCLHCAVMPTTDPTLEVDHIDGNKLNNLRSNLRLVSHRENMLNRGKQKSNTTGYTGVYLIQRFPNVWLYRAKYVYKGKQHYADGWFETAEEAHFARKALVKRLEQK